MFQSGNNPVNDPFEKALIKWQQAGGKEKRNERTADVRYYPRDAAISQ